MAKIFKNAFFSLCYFALFSFSLCNASTDITLDAYTMVRNLVKNDGWQNQMLFFEAYSINPKYKIPRILETKMPLSFDGSGIHPERKSTSGVEIYHLTKQHSKGTEHLLFIISLYEIKYYKWVIINEPNQKKFPASYYTFFNGVAEKGWSLLTPEYTSFSTLKDGTPLMEEITLRPINGGRESKAVLFYHLTNQYNGNTEYYIHIKEHVYLKSYQWYEKGMVLEL